MIKNKTYAMLISLIANISLIAMDPPPAKEQPQWWHTGKSGLCQIYRGISFQMAKDLEPQMKSPALLNNNQWWYSCLKVDHKDFLCSPVGLSDDGMTMGVVDGKQLKLYNATNCLQEGCIETGATVYAVSFRKGLIARGVFDKIMISNSRLQESKDYDRDLREVDAVDFNSTMVVESLAHRKLVFYDRKSGKKSDFSLKNNIAMDLVSMTDEKLVAVPSCTSEIHIYDLNTKELLLSTKRGCKAINLKGSLLAVALNCGDVELYDIHDGTSVQRLMHFSPCYTAHSVSISADGKSLAAGLSHCTAQLFRKYENYTLAQVQLKYALLKWLELEKPNKEIIDGDVSTVLEKLFRDISIKCELDYENECVIPWQGFLQKMQFALLNTINVRVLTYGKFVK